MVSIVMGMENHSSSWQPIGSCGKMWYWLTGLLLSMLLGITEGRDTGVAQFEFWGTDDWERSCEANQSHPQFVLLLILLQQTKSSTEM